MMHRPLPHPRTHAAARRRAVRTVGGGARAGMTLIEIMVVIVIIGLIATGVAFSINALPRARLRAGAMRMQIAFRAAYVHALTTGHTTRVAFQLGGHQITMEETQDAHTLDRRDPNRRGNAEDIEAEARRDAQLMTDLRPRAPRALWSPVTSRTFRPVTLEDTVVSRLYSPHENEPREQGNGYVYFFSGGLTERAVVHLRNTRGEIFSVALSPLTGHAEIFDRPVEPPSNAEREVNDQDEVDSRDTELQPAERR